MFQKSESHPALLTKAFLTKKSVYRCIGKGVGLFWAPTGMFNCLLGPLRFVPVCARLLRGVSNTFQHETSRHPRCERFYVRNLKNWENKCRGFFAEANLFPMFKKWTLFFNFFFLQIFWKPNVTPMMGSQFKLWIVTSMGDLSRDSKKATDSLSTKLLLQNNWSEG